MIIDTLISTLRPVTLKGKGFVLDRVTPRSGTRHARIAGAYAMTLDLANVIHRQIYMGCFANSMTRWTRALLRPGGTFLDVGAHAGYFSLLAADRVGPRGRVFSVEPNPAVCTTLSAHLTSNRISHAELCNWGLAEQTGTAALSVPDRELHRDYNATFLRRSDWTTIAVPVRRLDDCLTAWGVDVIDLMKIDVEGSEPHVLAGGAMHLARGVVRHLMVEVNGPRLVEAGSSPAALVDDLAALGFAPARIAGRRVTRLARGELDVEPTHEHDRLFVHKVALETS